MSARSSSEGSWGKRKSLFALTAIRSSDNNSDESTVLRLPKTLKKQRHVRTPSSFTSLDHPDVSREQQDVTVPATEQLTRPRSRKQSLSMRSVKRPHLVLESLKNGVRSNSEEIGDPAIEPLSATSSAPSLGFETAVEGLTPSKTVILHGEVQTSAGMFRKKKEYLVLTEVHIIRYKSQARAAETFKVIAHPAGRSHTVKHPSISSTGSQTDLQSLSDSSGDKDGKVLLRQVVAVYRLDDGKPYFALELCYLDEETGQANAMTLQFSNPEERDYWLKCIRRAVKEARSRIDADISAYNLENAARMVERDNDYDPANCAIFKVVQRQPTRSSSSRSSSDDLSKVAATVCFLAIGMHKLHLIQLVKPVARSSSPSLASNSTQVSHGVLTLSSIRVSGSDDTFELTFRQPLQKAKSLYLASSTSPEIVSRLHFTENFLRPACGQRLFKYIAPVEMDDLIANPVSAYTEEHSCLDRTLIAYCVAYGVNPTNIRYTVNFHCEDAPGFELFPPADTKRPNYTPLELLAIMRGLRYNETFGSISFAGIQLDSLNGLHDNYGSEMVCWRTKRGTAIRLSAEELNSSCLLVQEIRALAATSRRLRRMDFSGCITAILRAPAPTEEDSSRQRELGCGIVEALFSLCKYQTTNVDWICLNGIELCETDLEWLVGAAVDKSCHFRAIELNRCGLGDRSMGLILDALRAQENTLETLALAENPARLNPVAFDSQLGFFGFIRKLNLSYVSMTSGTEPFLQAETLAIWRLQELRLSGTVLNAATIDTLSTYLAHPQSASLRELYVDNASLSGSVVATLLQSAALDAKKTREMHIDISQSQLNDGIEKLAQAIANGLTPTHLTMKGIEWSDQGAFRKIIAALTSNKKIQFLDVSQTGLPGDATDETCRALQRLLAENDTLIELDLSGDDSRLAASKFGPVINQALSGLKENKSLKVFHITKQQLHLRGASALADVLRENRTLTELHCDNNEIPLQGLTDLVNSLIDNTTLIHLPQMDDGRTAAFRDAEATMRVMSDTESPVTPKETKPAPPKSESMMRRGFASVRRTAQRSTSSAPSFPALQSYGKPTTSSPHSRTSSPLSLTMPPLKKTQSSQSPVITPVTSFTVQDIQTTHRLLTEQWDRQCFRLAQYLERNYCLLHGVPCNMEIEDEKFERSGSVGSLGKLLEQVKFDTTPRVERDLYFDGPLDAGDDNERSAPTDETEPLEGTISFKQFILDSGPQSPASAIFEDDQLKQLRIDTNVDGLGEASTPTQKAFFP